MRKHLRKLFAIAGILVAGLLLWNTGRTIDWQATVDALASLSIVNMVTILLPFIVLSLLDSFAWRMLLPAEHRKASIWKMFKVRASGEAFVMTFPMGAVLSEPLKVMLLRRNLGIKPGESTASVILRSFIMGMGQALLVVVLTLLGFGFLTWVSQRIISRSSLEYILLIASALSLLFYAGLTIATTYGSIVEWLHSRFARSRWGFIKRFAKRSEKYFEELTSQFSTLGSNRSKNLWIAFALYSLVWSTEAAETYLILHLLGAQITLEQAFIVEGICSYLRAMAFVLPAGLGLEETLYLTMLTSSGVPVAIAAGFVIVKRTRELLWVALGYGFMLASGLKVRQVYPEPEVAQLGE